jgi:hypothetical protein
MFVLKALVVVLAIVLLAMRFGIPLPVRGGHRMGRVLEEMHEETGYGKDRLLLLLAVAWVWWLLPYLVAGSITAATPLSMIGSALAFLGLLLGIGSLTSDDTGDPSGGAVRVSPEYLSEEHVGDLVITGGEPTVVEGEDAVTVPISEIAEVPGPTPGDDRAVDYEWRIHNLDGGSTPEDSEVMAGGSDSVPFRLRDEADVGGLSTLAGSVTVDPEEFAVDHDWEYRVEVERNGEPPDHVEAVFDDALSQPTTELGVEMALEVRWHSTDQPLTVVGVPRESEDGLVVAAPEEDGDTAELASEADLDVELPYLGWEDPESFGPSEGVPEDLQPAYKLVGYSLAVVGQGLAFWSMRLFPFS